MNAIDLFAGCGGLSKGFMDAGFNIIVGVDNDHAALNTFALNHNGAKAMNADLSKQDTFDEIKRVSGNKEIDVIIAGPPCQGFSLSGPRNFDDERNKLYLAVIEMVKQFQPKGFVIENVPGTRNLLQNYFDSKGTYPAMYDSVEYSHYFQECYPLPMARQRFIDTQVSGCNPSLGYLCLADLVCKGRFKSIWTTNFDSLVETAINIIEPLKDYLVCSSANSSSIHNFSPNKPCVCKLHGDFRYDTLQNTSAELKTLEDEIYNYWLKASSNKGLVIIGYSGNDDSVMNFLESHIPNVKFLTPIS